MDFSEQAETIKREIEKAFRLPLGACDKVGNDIIRLFIWRDKKEDPGPLTEELRAIWAAHYFDELYSRRKAKGELIFRSAREARRCLRDYGFFPVSTKKVKWTKGALIARIHQSGVIYRIIVTNVFTRELSTNIADL